MINQRMVLTRKFVLDGFLFVYSFNIIERSTERSVGKLLMNWNENKSVKDKKERVSVFSLLDPSYSSSVEKRMIIEMSIRE